MLDKFKAWLFSVVSRRREAKARASAALSQQSSRTPAAVPMSQQPMQVISSTRRGNSAPGVAGGRSAVRGATAGKGVGADITEESSSGVAGLSENGKQRATGEEQKGKRRVVKRKKK